MQLVEVGSPCPEVGIYHPRMQSPQAVGLMANSVAALPEVARIGECGIVDLLLNPKWYEGVRQIELHVPNTTGWSATTGQVQPWVYDKLSETFMRDPAGWRKAGRRPPKPL